MVTAVKMVIGVVLLMVVSFYCTDASMSLESQAPESHYRCMCILPAGFKKSWHRHTRVSRMDDYTCNTPSLRVNFRENHEIACGSPISKNAVIEAPDRVRLAPVTDVSVYTNDRDRALLKVSKRKPVFYTVLVVDNDAPDRANPWESEYLHWLVVNIPQTALLEGGHIWETVNSTEHGLQLDKTKSLGDVIVSWSSPDPGEETHRYAVWAYRQLKIIPTTTDKYAAACSKNKKQKKARSTTLNRDGSDNAKLINDRCQKLSKEGSWFNNSADAPKWKQAEAKVNATKLENCLETIHGEVYEKENCTVFTQDMKKKLYYKFRTERNFYNGFCNATTGTSSLVTNRKTTFSKGSGGWEITGLCSELKDKTAKPIVKSRLNFDHIAFKRFWEMSFAGFNSFTVSGGGFEKINMVQDEPDEMDKQELRSELKQHLVSLPAEPAHVIDPAAATLNTAGIVAH